MRNIDNAMTRYGLGLIVLSVIPVRPDDDTSWDEEDESNADSQEINKDPIIGGADDVYRDNPSKSLRDSDLVDADPLQEERGVAPENEADEKEIDDEDIATPYEGDQDDANLHTLKEDGDTLDTTNH